MYGILVNNNGRLSVHNKIFEERIYNYLVEEYNKNSTVSLIKTEINRYVTNSLLNMELVLSKFKDFMYEEYRKEDEKFYESYGRFLFLAYLKPIINGSGFSFVEAQTRENRRMDIVITYGNEKHIVELKLWKGQKAEEKGFEQLCDYLDSQGVSKGYLIIFNLNKNKKHSENWISFRDKSIFEVVV